MNVFSQNLTLVCDKVSLQSDWITSLQEALSGVDASEASWKFSPEEPCIWEIVMHSIAWTQWVVLFLQGQDREVTDWPPIEGMGEADWEQARRKLMALCQTFREQVAALSVVDLEAMPTPEVTQTNRFVGIQSILIHNAYHAGQITKLRAWYRQRLRHT